MDAVDRERDVSAQADRSEATSRLIIEIAAAASGELDLDHILQTALARLRSVVRLTGGSIALVEGEELVVRAAVGPFADEALGQRLARGPSRSWGVIESRRPFLTGDLRTSGDRIRGARAAKVIQSWLAVPIVRAQEAIGLLEVDSPEVHAFGEDDVELLEGVVAVLGGHLELAAHHAESARATALREAFIGVISHELRTPITTIYGLARVLRQRGDGLAPDARREAIADIEAESDRLYRLVEDLLVLSRAEGGRVTVESEPISLGRLVSHIVAVERQRHPDREFLSRIAPDLPLIEAEATYLEQVVRNFLTNAVKYSRAPERIEIELLSEAGEIVLRVLDRGIGIDDETAEHAFDLFYRTTAASRTASGAGIGLFVCRELVGAMGGRTWIASRPGGGTEVGFRLPAVPPEAEIPGD